MRRFVVLMVVALAAIAAGVALAAPPPFHLGSPDRIFKSAGTDPELLLVPTDQCPGFAAGDSLSFPSFEYAYMTKEWSDAFDGLPWIERRNTFSATMVSNGLTYVFQARFDESRPAEAEIYGTGMVTITRDDGARMKGSAAVHWHDLLSRFDVHEWLGTPTCR